MTAASLGTIAREMEEQAKIMAANGRDPSALDDWAERIREHACDSPELVAFFRGEGYQRFGWKGDVHGWSPERTAIEAMREMIRALTPEAAPAGVVAIVGEPPAAKITADWVIGYLPASAGQSDETQDALRACREGVAHAFAEWAALSAAPAGEERTELEQTRAEIARLRGQVHAACERLGAEPVTAAAPTPEGRDTCERCDGLGSAVADDYDEQCDACDGTGKSAAAPTPEGEEKP